MDDEQLRHFNEVTRPRVRMMMRQSLYRWLRTDQDCSPEKARQIIVTMDRVTEDAVRKLRET